MNPAPLVLTPSAWEVRWLYLSHLLAALACVFSVWAITSVVAFSLYRSLYLRPAMPRSMMVLADGRIRLMMVEGKEVDFVLLPSSRVLGGLMVLHLQGDGQRVNIVLWPDSAPAECLRQWRIWLRWQWPALQKKQA